MAEAGLLEALLWAAAPSYLLGAIPVGLLVGRLFGLGDVRQIGSGNIGATNVLRTGNKKAAALTFALDVLKGAGPALIAGAYLGPWGAVTDRIDVEGDLIAGAYLGPWGAGLAGFAAFLGHCFSPFLGFKGGKGVATGLGALLAWRWEVALLALALFILIVWRTRYVSLGSLCASFFAVIGFAYLGAGPLTYFAAAMAAVSAYAHRENIGRLLRGEESKSSFGGGK